MAHAYLPGMSGMRLRLWEMEWREVRGLQMPLWQRALSNERASGVDSRHREKANIYKGKLVCVLWMRIKHVSCLSF